MLSDLGARPASPTRPWLEFWQSLQQMPAWSFSQEETAVHSVIPLQPTKIQHNSWKFHLQTTRVFALQIVYLWCISPAYCSRAVLIASAATGAGITASGRGGIFVKLLGDFWQAEIASLSLRCLLPSGLPPGAAGYTGSSSRLWTDVSGTPPPVEGPGGIKGAFVFRKVRAKTRLLHHYIPAHCQ